MSGQLPASRPPAVLENLPFASAGAVPGQPAGSAVTVRAWKGVTATSHADRHRGQACRGRRRLAYVADSAGLPAGPPHRVAGDAGPDVAAADRRGVGPSPYTLIKTVLLIHPILYQNK